VHDAIQQPLDIFFREWAKLTDTLLERFAFLYRNRKNVVNSRNVYAKLPQNCCKNIKKYGSA
jgi:hypothetical protein